MLDYKLNLCDKFEMVESKEELLDIYLNILCKLKKKKNTANKQKALDEVYAEYLTDYEK